MGQDVCDVFPAWDPQEGTSFSNGILRTMIFVVCLGVLHFEWNRMKNAEHLNTTQISLFEGFLLKRKSPQGDLRQETYRRAALWTKPERVKYYCAGKQIRLESSIRFSKSTFEHARIIHRVFLRTLGRMMCHLERGTNQTKLHISYADLPEVTNSWT